MVVLGLGGSGHDWASCAIDGQRVAALDEERVTRKKYGLGSDLLAAASRQAVLAELGVGIAQISHVVACDLVPRPFYFSLRDRIHLINHHLAHAYSTFVASGFDQAAVLVCDNSGSLLSGSKAQDEPGRTVETISLYHATRDGIELVEKVAGAHYVDAATESGYYRPGSTDNSLGHFYRTASLSIGLSFRPAGTGYAVSEDGKTMGLAPYGDQRYVAEVAELVNLEPDGRITATAETIERTFRGLAAGADLDQRAAVAYAAQHTLERALLHCATYLRARTGADNLCLAGGVALNSSANGVLLEQAGFQRVFVVPAAGDNGISLGCAYYAAHQLEGRSLADLPPVTDAYLGLTYTQADLDAVLAQTALRVQRPDDMPDRVATILAEGKVVGWFDGRSEFGPRALGHRSILAAPFPAAMRDHLNGRVKHREWFRPYAPVILANRRSDYFDIEQPSPYMLFITKVRRPDEIPAVTHVDGTARLQTLEAATNPRLYEVLEAFERTTGCPVLLNTSFNVAGEPIVESPFDALRAFVSMPLDYLVLGNALVSRGNTP